MHMYAAQRAHTLCDWPARLARVLHGAQGSDTRGGSLDQHHRKQSLAVAILAALPVFEAVLAPSSLNLSRQSPPGGSRPSS